MEKTHEGGFGKTFFLLVIFVILVYAIWMFTKPLTADLMTQVSSGTYQRVSDHGITKHPEAKAIEESCNKNVYQIWRDKYQKKYYYLCQVGDNTWGIIPVVVTAGQEVWKTAFSPGSGCWSDVIRYLGNTATRYSGTVR